MGYAHFSAVSWSRTWLRSWVVRIADALVQNPILLSLATLVFWISILAAMGSLTAPPEGDERDYIQRGISFAQNGLTGLADGYRPPVFVSIIGALSVCFHGETLLLAVRLFNLLLVALIPASWLLAPRFSSIDPKICVLMAVFTALWPPFFLLGRETYAEGVSFLMLNLLIATSLGFSYSPDRPHRILRSMACAFLLAALFLTKPNQILVAPVFALLAFTTMKGGVIERSLNVAIMTFLICAMILPWMLFMHNTTGEWKPTTTGGLALLVGTGHDFLGMTDKIDHSVLPTNYMSSKHIFRQTDHGPSALSSEDETALSRANSLIEKDRISEAIGIKIWRESTQEQIIHGGLKVIHSLGGSLRGVSDYFFALFTALVIACSVFAFLNRVCMPIVGLHWGIALAGFIIAFFFLPNIRFKTFYFDSSGLLVVAATLSYALGRREGARAVQRSVLECGPAA